MTDSTPAYGIRYPDARTKLVDLGPELALFAGDVERVLQSVSIPPAAALPAVVANTQAARDQAWGVPSTDTQRRNLQNLGATTIRPDKGWTERYFALYHATNNPGGASAAGWYPVEGVLPRVSLTKTSAQTTTPNAQTMLWDQSTGTPGLYQARDRITPNLRGLWRFEYTAVADLQNTQTLVAALGFNGVQVPSSECWVSGNSMGAATALVTVDVLVTNPGADYLTGLVYAPGVGDAKTLYPAKVRMSARYLGPA